MPAAARPVSLAVGVGLGHAFGVGDDTFRDQRGVTAPDPDLELEAQPFDLCALREGLAA